MELKKITEKRQRKFIVICSDENKIIGENLTEQEAVKLGKYHQTKEKHVVQIRKDVTTTVLYELVK